jgi:hypothetical protein
LQAEISSTKKRKGKKSSISLDQVDCGDSVLQLQVVGWQICPPKILCLLELRLFEDAELPESIGVLNNGLTEII